MTTPTPWSDVPPSEAGEWWVRRRSDGATLRLTLLPDGYWITSPYMVKSGRVAEQFQFGPRVLSAEETVDLTVEVERLKSEVEFLKSRMAGMIEVFGAVRMAVGQNVMGSDPVEEPDYDAPWLPCGLLVRIDNVMEREYRE